MVLSSVAGPEPFAVMVDKSDPAVVVVSVVGEIDKLTEAPLHDHISSALATRPAQLIIDLGGVSFLGAAGLSVLITARNTAAHQGTTLTLRLPHQPGVARALEITGLHCLFEILPLTGPDKPQNHRVADVSHAGEADQDEYAAMALLQRRYAELASDDPERQRLRDAVIRGYLPVAAHIARRFAGRGEPLEDLIQVATIGLINAVDRFEPDRGGSFFLSRYRRSPASYADTSATTAGLPGCHGDSKICICRQKQPNAALPANWAGHHDPVRSPISSEYRSAR